MSWLRRLITQKEGLQLLLPQVPSTARDWCSIYNTDLLWIHELWASVASKYTQYSENWTV